MERVRTKLVEEAQGIKKSEAAKKQRELKKYGKQIQHEKLKQREMDKKSFMDKTAGVKRSECILHIVSQCSTSLPLERHIAWLWNLSSRDASGRADE